MKAHIGVDECSGLVHTVIGTSGNVADITQAHELLHGQESRAARVKLLVASFMRPTAEYRCNPNAP